VGNRNQCVRKLVAGKDARRIQRLARGRVKTNPKTPRSVRVLRWFRHAFAEALGFQSADPNPVTTTHADRKRARALAANMLLLGRIAKARRALPKCHAVARPEHPRPGCAANRAKRSAVAAAGVA